MKAKPIIISLICLVILICLCIFIKSRYFSKPEKAEITQFLNNFKNELKDEHIDSAINDFEAGKNNKQITLLVKVLAGKTGMNGKSAPTFNISLNTDDNKIIFSNSTNTIAEVPVSFMHAGMDTKQAVITFTIHKIADHQFKIAEVKTGVFLKGYMAYAILVRNKTVPEDAIYSAITLAAFKTADKLKSRYDSVLWFEHINKRTWFYVIKGTLNKEFYWLNEHKAEYKPTYKMGLVNPDLKEVIPTEYDLIHNISGSIQGLIEVEKDGKKGFYNMDGKLVLPVTYDQIFPLKADDNLALLRNGDDYFYLKSDSTISDKIQDFKIADVLPKIKTYGDSYTLSDESSENIMEYNDREDFTSLVVAPSYLVDWGILEQFVTFENPLRKPGADNDGIEASGSIEIKYEGARKDESNWFESAFYSLYNDYLGGRSGLYVSKHVLMVDKKQNRILTFNTSAYEGPGDGGGALSGKCNENGLRAINDTLFEFKTTVQLYQNTLTDTIDEAPYYHYLHIKNGKLEALPNERAFGCTKYVKLDDSYLQGCYVVNGRAIDRATPAIIQYMKNEIYASYLYKFKNDAWNTVFIDRFNDPDNKSNVSVDDSLTVIDKYNINWLNQKLKGSKSNTLAAE
jgi:hypothetical protein